MLFQQLRVMKYKYIQFGKNRLKSKGDNEILDPEENTFLNLNEITSKTFAVYYK